VQIDAEVTNLLALQHALHRVLPVDEGASTRGEHVIAVTDEGEDLDVVCSLTGLDRRGAVAAHTGRAWQVAFCGFAPGFAYLVGGDPRLEVHAGMSPGCGCQSFRRARTAPGRPPRRAGVRDRR